MFDEVKRQALGKAHLLYGANPLPKEIQERLDLELGSIKSNGWDTVYVIARKLADKSREYGYMTGFRGCIGSSLVAFLMEITQCNPLPQKYYGFNIPFETFAGVDFNKELDITLNVAYDIHKEICEYLDELLKEEGIDKNSGDIEQSNGIYNFKRTIVSKEGKKLATINIVSHKLLMPLKELCQLTKHFPRLIRPDEDVREIVDLLIKEEFYIHINLERVLDIISKIEIDTFEKLVILQGLLYAAVTDNCIGDILLARTSDLSQIISHRDDIMIFLMQKGIDRVTAYHIMESVRKGKGTTKEMDDIMREKNVPDWYIKICNHIDYLFPKAHNVGYAILEYQLAWYGIHYPEEYAKVMEKWRG